MAMVFSLTPQFSIAQPGKGGPSPVVSGRAVKIRRAGTESFVGTLRPIRQTVVGSAVDGRVIKVHIAEGDPVTAESKNSSLSNELSLDPGQGDSLDNDDQNFRGQALVQLRTGTLDIEIESAEIQEKLARQILSELEISIPKNIESAKALLAGAKAKLVYSKANFDRSQNLSTRAGAISELELEQARSLFQADQQAVLAAEADYQRILTTREILLAQARTRADSSAQEVKRLQDLRLKYTIRAPRF